MDDKTNNFYKEYNASQARKTAEESKTRLTPQKVRVIDSIVSTSKFGKTEMTYQYNLCDDSTIKFLEEKGFKVELIHDFRDGDYLVIKW